MARMKWKSKAAGMSEQDKKDPPLPWKERQYEKLRGKISVRTLDIIIAVLVVALAAVIILGIINRSPS